VKYYPTGTETSDSLAPHNIWQHSPYHSMVPMIDRITISLGICRNRNGFLSR
ncbi:uncharacterized protein METZ01_LOCUS151233, partial [marine metagenome]